MLAVYIINILLAVAGASESCLKRDIPNFKIYKSIEGVEHFINDDRTLSLSVKCFGRGIRLSEIKGRLAKELTFRSLAGNLEYFDFNREDVLSRTYFHTNSNGLNQLSYVTNVKSFKAFTSLNDHVLRWINTP